MTEKCKECGRLSGGHKMDCSKRQTPCFWCEFPDHTNLGRTCEEHKGHLVTKVGPPPRGYRER